MRNLVFKGKEVKMSKYARLVALTAGILMGRTNMRKLTDNMRKLTDNMRALSDEELVFVSGGLPVCINGHCFDFQDLPPDVNTMTRLDVVDVPFRP